MRQRHVIGLVVVLGEVMFAANAILIAETGE